MKGLVESEEERQGGSAKATPVRSSKKPEKFLKAVFQRTASDKLIQVKGNGSKQQTSSSSNESSSRPHRYFSSLVVQSLSTCSSTQQLFQYGFLSSNSSQSIWPVATMKLLSPASKNSSAPREPTEEVKIMRMMMLIRVMMLRLL